MTIDCKTLLFGLSGAHFAAKPGQNPGIFCERNFLHFPRDFFKKARPGADAPGRNEKAATKKRRRQNAGGACPFGLTV